MGLKEPIEWAGIAVVRDKRVLLLKEADKPFLIFPGGKLEYIKDKDGKSRKETNTEAALRETWEELGVIAVIKNVEPILVIETTSKSTGKPFTYRLFEATLPEDPEIDDLPGKSTGIHWVNSFYEQDDFEVGNLPAQALPLLAQMGKID